MSGKITDFFSPIQEEGEITKISIKNDTSQFKNQKTKKSSVILKDFLGEIKYADFESLKFGPNINNSAKNIQQNQPKVKPEETPKLKAKNYEKKCDTCNKIFPVYKDFYAHKCTYKCKFCDCKFNFKSTRANHMKRKHQNDVKALNINCYICDEFLISKISLDLHMKINHSKKNAEKFECDFCGKIFMSRGNLYKHMIMHLPKVNCSICQAELSINTLNIHMKNVHAKGTNFQCRICEKAFKSKMLLSLHEKYHDKKFECKVCTKRFIKIWELNTHMQQYHLNPRSFSCEICDKRFNKKSDLKSHQRFHDKNRPKPFKCQRCDYASDRKNDYQKHMKFHERQDIKFAAMKNPLKCEKCGTFCKDKKALSKHMNAVHPKELFQCDLCGNYKKSRNHLILHIKIHIINSN